MDKKEYFYILIVLIVLVIASFFAFKILRGNCDNKGCMENGCYVSLRENQFDNMMNCVDLKGYEWNGCKQSCELINYSSIPDNYTLCEFEVYESYFKAINIDEVSENITMTHFCDYLVINNNETCEGNDYWEYYGVYKKCAILRFR